MDKKFSEGFMHDIADLLEMCRNRNTDNVELFFDINDKTLNVKMIFSVASSEQGTKTEI